MKKSHSDNLSQVDNLSNCKTINQSFDDLLEGLISQLNIKQCCSNKPKFKTTFENGQTFLVCLNCSKLPHWSRSVKNVENMVFT